jgi:hypothetical protein
MQTLAGNAAVTGGIGLTVTVMANGLAESVPNRPKRAKL